MIFSSGFSGTCTTTFISAIKIEVCINSSATASQKSLQFNALRLAVSLSRWRYQYAIITTIFWHWYFSTMLVLSNTDY